MKPRPPTLTDLKKSVKNCKNCDLYKNATQSVFGAGNPRARIFLIGEQPGDKEDLAGEPFIGPAGKLLNRALELASLDRKLLYITNAVKHFKWMRSGKRRIHQKPNAIEIKACRPWLESEIEAIKPALIICLGSTATQAIFGATIKVMKDRGRPLETRFAKAAFVTIHPSAVLRVSDPTEREHVFQSFVADLAAAYRYFLRL